MTTQTQKLRSLKRHHLNQLKQYHQLYQSLLQLVFNPLGKSKVA